MKPASVRDLKQELVLKTNKELVELVLKMAKQKKENKELMSYFLFHSNDEPGYIKDIKFEVEEMFQVLNFASLYQTVKGVRKILKFCKKHIRFSKQKQTEVEVLLMFCQQVFNLHQRMNYSTTLYGIYERQLEIAKKKLTYLHEDLQYDYQLEIDELEGNDAPY